MKITYLGIELIRAKRSDLDHIRRWRNQLQVRQFMQHQALISSEIHLQWFDRIQNNTHFYFILEKDHEKGGLLQLSDIDYLENRAEVGILIGEHMFKGSHLPWLGSYALLRFAFDILQLEQLRATVCEKNEAAKEYNQSLGFRQVKKQDNGFGIYTLDPSTWRKATQAYRKILKRLGAKKMSIHFHSQITADRSARRLIRHRSRSTSLVGADLASHACAERDSDLAPTSCTSPKKSDLHKVSDRS